MKSILNNKMSKQKEMSFLTNSQIDIKSKLDLVVDKQLLEVEKERIKLEYKFSIDYLIEKVRSLSIQNEKLKEERDALELEFNTYFNILNENQKKLYLEVIKLLNTIRVWSIKIKQFQYHLMIAPIKITIVKVYYPIKQVNSLSKQIILNIIN